MKVKNLLQKALNLNYLSNNHEIFIYLFISSLIGCKNIKKEVVLKPKEEISINQSQVQYDTLSISQVLFNNEPMNISYDKLKIKKEDSIVFSEWACGHPFEWKNDTIDFWSYYSKNLEYITNKEEAILYSGNFEENIFRVKNRNIKLTEKSIINDFEKIFPLSYKHYVKTKKTYPNDYNDEDYIYIAFEGEHPYHHWIFYFDKEGFLIWFKLYWWLC